MSKKKKDNGRVQSVWASRRVKETVCVELAWVVRGEGINTDNKRNLPVHLDYYFFNHMPYKHAL